MILVAFFIGAVLIVAAVRNSQAALFNALGQDIPPFIVWAAAIFALGVIGYIPNIKPVSRALIALVLVVIVLKNYQNILTGFQSGVSQAEQPAQSATQAGAQAGITSGKNIGNIVGSTITEIGTQAIGNATQGIFDPFGMLNN